MIDFFTKSLALVLALFAGAAMAAPDNAPHVTAPSLEQMESDKEERADPTDAEGSVAVEPKDTIHTATVTASPVEGFGTLLQGKGGGLPEDIWKGSVRETVDPLLSNMRTGVTDATLQDLFLRLLMTQATPPQGTAGQSWFSLRVNTLIAIGQDDKAEQMIASLPASMTDTHMLEVQAGLQLARGQYDQACQKAQPGSLPAETGTEGFWRKLSILCQARAGKQDEAMVGIELMREENHIDDPFFQEAVRHIGDKNAPIKSTPKQWTLLNVAVLRLANDTEKLKSVLDAFPPVAVKYISQDATLDAKLRERARTRAEQAGVIGIAEGNVTPEPPFSKELASDVTTLVTALGSGKPANDADNAVIARLALDNAGIGDSRRVQRLLSLMEPFGYRVPNDVWAKLFAHRQRFDGDVPPAPLVTRLNEAATAGKRGEAIVLATLVAGASRTDKITDLALLPIIKALQAAGFEKEARAMAHGAVKAYSGR